MIPGPDYIIGCPSCGAPHRRGSLMSGNTFGARWWSDGKREAPMLPSSPLVTRCRGCGRYFWLHRGEPLGRISVFSEPSLDVVLVDVGPRRLKVLGVLRRVLGEKAPEGHVLHAPLELARELTRGKADALIRELREAGATARVRPVWAPPAKPWVEYQLTAVGPRRIEVLAVLREHFHVSLPEVKGLLEHLPLQLPLMGLHFEDFHALIARYRAAGATVTEREVPPEVSEPLPGEAFPPEWLELPWVKELPEEELLAALAAGVARDREEERELRLRAWWAGNDPYREPGAAWKPFSERAPAARENLRALQALLEPDEPLEGLLKAEALRELEHFDEARALLARVPSREELRKVGEQLLALAERRVPEVRVTIGS